MKILTVPQIKKLKTKLSDLINTESGQQFTSGELTFKKEKNEIVLRNKKTNKRLASFKKESEILSIYNDLVLKKANNSFSLILEIVKDIHSNVENRNED